MLHIARMVQEYLLAQGRHVDMGIYFCRTDGLVTQHGLDGSQVSATFQQGGGKGVAQGVWRDGFLDAGFLCLLLNHDENHGARQVDATPVQKDIVFFARLDFHEVTVDKPMVELPDGFGRYGNKAFF